MSDLPSFVRPSDRLPLTTTDSDYPHIVKRAFELTVDLEELVRIEDAAEHLVELIFGKFKNIGTGSFFNFVWLSGDIVVFDGGRGISGTYEFAITLDHDILAGVTGTCDVMKPYHLSICEVSTADVLRANSTNNIGGALDIILRLLANHKSILTIQLLREGTKKSSSC